MGRLLRYVAYPMQTFELVWRCAQSRFLLRPDRRGNRRVLGVLGQAMTLFAEGEVELYFAGGTCNHIHLLMGFASAEVKAAWTCHVRANLSKELGLLFDWPGSHWDRRSSDIAILDNETLYARLVYLAGQATRAGLVRRAANWPGVRWIQAVTTGEVLVGEWVDRTRLYRMRQAWRARPEAERGRYPTEADTAERRVVSLAPVPMWAGLSEAEQQTRWREVVAIADAESRPGGAVLGRAGILALDPHARPSETKRGMAPAVHARSRADRAAWYAAYGAFAAAYRQAMAALRAGIEGFGFPVEGCRPVGAVPARGG